MSVKIGVINAPTITTPCALSRVCSARGVGIDVANIVCEYLRLNCTFILYPNSDWGDADEFGNATGLVEDIQNGNYDLSLPMMQPTYRRFQAITFSQIYVYTKSALVTRAPNANLDKLNWNFLFTFQWPVVLAFFSALLLISLIIRLRGSSFFYDHSNSDDQKNQQHVFELVQICSSMITRKYHPSIMRFNSVTTMICLWTMGTLVLGSAYTGMLFSQKITKVQNAPFVDMETFTRCLEEKRCRLIMQSKLDSYYLQLTAPVNPLSARIKKSVDYNPVLIVAQEKIAKTILEEREVYLVWFWVTDFMLYAMSGNVCSYYLVDTPYAYNAAFGMRKNYSLANTLKKFAFTFRQAGLGDAVLRNYARRVTCDGGFDGFKSWLDEGTGLYAFRTIFYFYVVGATIAVGAVILELTLHYLHICIVK